MKTAKRVKTILCDDVRQEIGNKLSLIGVYSKDIVVRAALPALMPMLHLVVMFEGIKEPFEEIFLRVVMPEAESTTIVQPAPAMAEGDNINIIVVLTPFIIKGTGKAKFEMRFTKGGRASVVHRFSIKTDDRA